MTGSRAFGLPFRHHPEPGEHDHTHTLTATTGPAVLHHAHGSLFRNQQPAQTRDLTGPTPSWMTQRGAKGVRPPSRAAVALRSARLAADVRVRMPQGSWTIQARTRVRVQLHPCLHSMGHAIELAAAAAVAGVDVMPGHGKGGDRDNRGADGYDHSGIRRGGPPSPASQRLGRVPCGRLQLGLLLRVCGRGW